MTCDSLMLCRLATEINELRGQRVGRVFAVGRAALVVECNARGPLPQIVLDGSPEHGRAHRDEGLAPGLGHDTPLTDVARRHLRGAILLGAEQRAFDRVLTLQFGNCEGLGPRSRRLLVAEIMGRHSNLLLLDDDGTILECARHVTAQVNRVRQSLPGEEYVPPPDFGKQDPRTVTVGQFLESRPLHPQPLGAWLRSCWQGLSDLFLNVLCFRADLAPNLPTDRLDDPSLTRLLEATQELTAEAVRPGPGYVARPPGKLPVAYPVPLPEDFEVLGEYPNLSAACAMLHRRLAAAASFQALRQRLSSVLTAARDKAARRERERQATLRRAGSAPQLRQKGELLLANLHLIQPRQGEIELDNWYTGQTESIRLDPHLSPQQNAQRYFDRYKKMQRVKERVPGLLAQATVERTYLEDLLDQIEGGELAELRLIEQELTARGLLKTPRRGRRDIKVDYRRTETEDGYAMIYGRNGLENVAVLKAARPDDLWFHVQGTPGGHVVVRTDNQPEAVPPATILEAARLAARQSRRRREASVAVDYTLVKHLTHVKGAPPGYVIYRDFHTVTVKGER